MSYDVILVLGGGIYDDGTLDPSILKRVEKAKELFTQKKAPRILLTGRWSTFRDRTRHLPPRTEAKAMAQYAIKLGIPPKAILLEERSHNTWENVLNAKTLFLTPHNWNRILVVTSSFHSLRARILFRVVLGPQYQVDFVVTKARFDSIHWLTLVVKKKFFWR